MTRPSWDDPRLPAAAGDGAGHPARLAPWPDSPDTTLPSLPSLPSLAALPAPPAPAAPPGRAAGAPAERLRARLRADLTARLAARLRADDDAGAPPLTAADREAFAAAVLAEAAEAHTRAELGRGAPVVAPDDEQRIVTEVLAEVFGLGGLEPLLADPAVENININGDRVFVRYADGRRERLPAVTSTDAELVALVRDLAARTGVEERRFDRGSPGVSFQLADGSRVFAVMAVTARPSVSVRRHRLRRVTLAALRANGTLDPGLEALLGALVRARKNILVTGGTAMGKTTLLRALAAAIPPAERLVTVEDVFELALGADADAHPDVVALQTREANTEGEGAISAAELVRWALRMSPDRVIVGECRGVEVVPMLNAMSQGNDGSMATLHASGSRGAFTRLAAYAAQGPERLPMEAVNLLVASAVHVVVHLAEPRGEPGRRVVSSVREVVGAEDRHVVTNEIYRPGPDRRATPGVPPTTELLEDLAEAGFDPRLFSRAWWG
jgi:Flp pilus assembly CpaF family ATPase